jgi:hypothetical protein
MPSQPSHRDRGSGGCASRHDRLDFRDSGGVAWRESAYQDLRCLSADYERRSPAAGRGLAGRDRHDYRGDRSLPLNTPANSGVN